ncbi:nineteen complex-related protein 2-domain-containing protein [Phialemonium atrogriseum]|uniref:Nineteen complex-related protein 2-domain-containing protein n=1 Tax=Phialemonium atrogriseum TaxID=1093897 RepID=A0AAJ0BUY7_9PEZI|nr:nineteen complex-related protein 2-domain-containing protein [Phialemonium atrogriseum]KAK1764731.1 nineteen complex-related protein 2-domain-containing protein [Phialemonium atrogriseum]
MSAFGAKRKPRIIQTLDDDEVDKGLSLGIEEEQKQEQPQGPIKFGRRPIKSSSLRKSINFNDDDADADGEGGAPASDAAAAGREDTGVPIVIRPSIARSGSMRQKKKSSSSRLSFGPGESTDDDVGAAPTPKKTTLGKKALENNAIKKSSSLQNLPTRFLGGEEDRPRYSKEYLDELQSSTPNTPDNLASLRIADDEEDVEMSLDPSELDGATVVQSSSTDAVAVAPSRQPAATVLTEGQIREKKERRARLAREADFISLDDGDDDGDNEDGSDAETGATTVSVQFSKKKAESRLMAEDEDLGEGYDEFVEDGGLSVGRQAEREARRRQRREMAELIHAAEEGSDAESDGSEAERRAAYEAAQRRAGMDGLRRADDDDDGGDGVNVIPRMRPLPDLEDCLLRMRGLVQGLEDEVTRKRARIAEMRKEKEEILRREREVQEVLDRAGAKYQSLAGAPASDVARMATQSPLRPIPPGLAGDLPVERGLESFGTTPTRRLDDEEMG